MKRKALIKSKEYLISQIQLNLLNLIGSYKDKKQLKDYELAIELGVSKGYVSQLLNATSDHKISKIVELALACNTVPLLYFVDLDKYIENDSKDLTYELFPISRPRNIAYEVQREISVIMPKSKPLVDFHYDSSFSEEGTQTPFIVKK